MTDPHETARKLVGAGWWEWQDRMLARTAEYTDVLPGTVMRMTVDVEAGRIPGEGFFPDLSDPATCGVLLGMLMEREPDAWVDQRPGMTFIRLRDGTSSRVDISAPTLGEALALALLEMKETTDE